MIASPYQARDDGFWVGYVQAVPLQAVSYGLRMECSTTQHSHVSERHGGILCKHSALVEAHYLNGVKG